MPARILQKSVLTIIVADRKLKRILHAVEEKTSRFARPVMVCIIGTAVGVLAVVGAVDQTPPRLSSKTLQRGLGKKTRAPGILHGHENGAVGSDQSLQDPKDILETPIVLESRGRFGAAIRMPVRLPTAGRQADAHRFTRRRPMCSTDLRKADMRAKGLTAQLVEFRVGQVFDVPLDV